MKVAIMQPYFLPYIGYFQLISAADIFVVYDNIKYTKKGWMTRNRMLQNGESVTFSLSLKHGSDALDVRDREISVDFNPDKLLNQISSAYRRAPYFEEVFPLLERIVRHNNYNLFNYLHHSIVSVCDHLDIATEIVVSSSIAVDREIRGQDKVIAICNALGASTYINAIGGVDLYSGDIFKAHGIDLRFIKSNPVEYFQFGNDFVPWLSVVDVLMFNSKNEFKKLIKECSLL